MFSLHCFLIISVLYLETSQFQGGYMASKKMKLAAQFTGQRDFEAEDQNAIGSDLFKGISIFVNGYTSNIFYFVSVLLLLLLFCLFLIAWILNIIDSDYEKNVTNLLYIMNLLKY